MKNKIVKSISLIILLLTFATNFQLAIANSTQMKGPEVDDLLYKFETEGDGEPVTTDYILNLPEQEYGTLMGKVAFYLLIVANILAFVSFVGAGIYMVISQGNEENITKAKQIFIYTLMAMVIAATALALVTGITNIQFF